MILNHPKSQLIKFLWTLFLGISSSRSDSYGPDTSQLFSLVKNEFVTTLFSLSTSDKDLTLGELGLVGESSSEDPPTVDSKHTGTSISPLKRPGHLSVALST